MVGDLEDRYKIELMECGEGLLGKLEIGFGEKTAQLDKKAGELDRLRKN